MIPTGKQLPELPYVRIFDTTEIKQIQELKDVMSTAYDVESWNNLRNECKDIWPEKIISAVDGLRKWSIKYDKPSKPVTHLGVKF
jgi:hypothetical protein